MKIIIAPDSFKDALPALQVCEAIQKGVLRALPEAKVQVFPLADGGEGTVEVLAWHLGGEMVEVEVADPLFRPIKSQFFLVEKKDGEKIAFVEMAQASGLQLLTVPERSPLKSSTFGTGQLILEALHSGATEIHLAIGGSATNDAGIGMAAALGWRFLDKNGVELLPIGENLIRVQSIEAPNPNSFATSTHPKFKVLCDVNNPLFGSNGAAHVFAPQKGADANAVHQLDEGLRHFAEVVNRNLGTDFSQKNGAGAAGGLGFGAIAFVGASVSSGAENILELVDFEEFVKNVDLVITGEGKLDGQTSRGKLVASVCQKANALEVPVIAICGDVTASEDKIQKLGLLRAVQLQRQGESLVDSLARTAEALETKAYDVLKTIFL